MAHCSLMPLKGTPETGVYVWLGRMSVAAGGAVTAATSWGKGATFTKGASGEYTIQLSRAYRGASATGGVAQLTITKAAAGVQEVELKSEDYSAGTFVVRFISTATGTGTDPAAAVDLNITLFILDSTVPKG